MTPTVVVPTTIGRGPINTSLSCDVARGAPGSSVCRGGYTDAVVRL
jgi:hypothetical protein